MALTRIDCHCFRGSKANSDTSSYVMINPDTKPGGLVLGGASAVRAGIGSQVACKLSLEHFVDGVFGYFQTHSESTDAPLTRSADLSLRVLEVAFRSANSAVFEFGSKLAAGGRMSASLLGIVLEDKVIAAARAGGGSAFLLRSGAVFPFFEEDANKVGDPALGVYIGAQSMISVELASVPVQENDVVVIFSKDVQNDAQESLAVWAQGIDFTSPKCGEELSRVLFPDVDDLAFSIVIRIGPETIYLAEIAN